MARGVILSIGSSFNDRGSKAAQREMLRMAKTAELAGQHMTAGMFRGAAAVGRIGAQMQRVGSSMTRNFTLPIAALGIVVWKMGSEFDATMRQMRAASGATDKDMAALTATAKKWGTSSIYSAQEVAGSMLELAKSGMKPAQMQAGALKATLDLAAAGELELASAAETTTNAMGMFGLGAKQAGQIADALAGGANASSASVDSLRQALSQVGPGARNAGLDLQETTAVLAAFANKGIQGSDAGTSLKTMLQRLIPQTDKAREAMQKYGLSFVDSKGNIDDITTVAQKLKSHLGGLSQAQRNAALATIFGSDATRAATVLMQEGGRGLQTYIKATRDRQAAEKMAAAQTNSDAGQVKQATAAMKTAAIDAQTAMAPAVRSVAGWVSGLAKGFANLSPGWQDFAVKAAAAGAAAGPLLVVMGKIAGLSSTVMRGVASIGMAMGENARFAPQWAQSLVNVSRGIGSITKAAVVGTGRLIAHTAATVAHTVVQGTVAIATKAWAAAQWILNAALTANPIGLVIVAVAGLVAGLIIAWKKSETFRNIVTGAFNAVRSVASAVFGWLKSAASTAWNFVLEVFRRSPYGILAANFGKVVSFMRGVGGRIKSALGNLGSLLYNVGRDVIAGLIRGVTDKLSALWSTLSSAASRIKSTFTSVLGISSPSKVFRDYGRDSMRGFALGIADMTSAIGRQLASTTFGMDVPSLAVAGGGTLSASSPAVTPRPVASPATLSGSRGGFLQVFHNTVNVSVNSTNLNERQLSRAIDDGVHRGLEKFARERRLGQKP